jgi:single-strand DNA-binding protein
MDELRGNKVVFTGYAGADPKLRILPDGRPLLALSIATTSRWTDRRSGKPKKHTEWHAVVFWDEMARDVAERAKKGIEIYIEGEIRTRSWVKDGVTKSKAEIQATDVLILGAGKIAGTPSQELPALGD